MANEATWPFNTVKFIWKLVLGEEIDNLENHISMGSEKIAKKFLIFFEAINLT